MAAASFDARPARDDFVETCEPSSFDRNLAALEPQVRQAFLFTTVEGFSQDEATTIMGIDSAQIVVFLERGACDLAHEVASSILSPLDANLDERFPPQRAAAVRL